MVGRRGATVLSVLVCGLIGCSSGPVAEQVVTETPASTPGVRFSPTTSPTPSQEELSRQVQTAYQIAFEEFERLSREGGADQPSAKMLEVEEPGYLDQDMALLKDQKATGFVLEGRQATTKSRPARGAAKSGSNPDLTIQICEDRRGSFTVEPSGRRDEGRLAQGFVYARTVSERVKLVDVDTRAVQACDW